MLNFRFLFVIAGMSLLFHACMEKGDTPVSEPPFEEICTLNQEEELLGRMNSIDYIRDSLFVVCTESQIYLYDFSGTRVRKIGRAGRTKSEYVAPMIVRADQDRIFVWDGMLAKFLWFSVEGELLGERFFDKGVSDFLVDGDCLWIYTADNESDRCICKLNLENGETEIQDFLPVVGAHHVLVRWTSRAPMAMKEGVLWCMPKNRLEIYRSDDSRVLRIKSESFKVEEVDEPKAITDDREKTMEYLYNNPFVLAVRPTDRSVQVLTAEGQLKMTKTGMDRSRRFYSVYSYDLSNDTTRKLIRFSQGAFSPENLMIGPDGFYCLAHKIVGEDDQYRLERLVL